MDDIEMNFYHDGSLGDIIYSLPVVKKMGGGNYYVMKKRHFGPIRSLLSSLPYITSVNYGPWINSGVDFRAYRRIAIDAARRNEAKHLADCHAAACEIAVDREERWIENLDPINIGEIVVNRSLRYHDIMDVDYGLLRDRDVVFLGRAEEYRVFKEIYPMECWHHECEDILEMARMIAGAKLFVGNQSLGFAIAEAMKVPRVLEVCVLKDNCRPAGKDGYTKLSQEVIVKYVKEMIPESIGEAEVTDDN